MDFHIEITGKHVIKTILFLAVAVFLIFLAFSDGRSTLTTTEETCTKMLSQLVLNQLVVQGLKTEENKEFQFLGVEN